MADHVVDTNVLIVASAAEGVNIPYDDVDATPDQIQIVFDWLCAFRDDPGRTIVLDEAWGIYPEYRNKLSDQHFGLQVVHAMFDRLRYVSVEYDENGYGKVPDTLASIDHSDKKFVAAALNDPDGIEIVNAVDSDWSEKRTLLQQHGVTVLELIR